MTRTRQLLKLVFRSRYTLAVMVVLGVGGAFFLYQEADQNETARARDEMSRRSDAQHVLIRGRINAFAESLYSVRSVLRIHSSLSPDSFFLLSRDVIERHPEFQALAWVTPSDSGPRAAPSSRPYSIRFIEPLLGLGRSVDRDAQIDSLRSALEHARLTNALTVSEPLTVPGDSGGLLCALVCPVYTPILTGARTGEGHGDFFGYLVGFVRFSTLLGRTRSDSSGLAPDVMMIDASAHDPQKRVLGFRSATFSPGEIPWPSEKEFIHGWYREVPLPIGGRIWLVRYRSNPESLERQGSPIPGLLFAGSVLVTLLFAAYLRRVIRRAENIEQNVNERTNELRTIQAQLEEDIRRREDAEQQLRASQQQLHALMENSPSGIFMKDTDGRFVAVNRRFSELHGRAREDFVGRSDLDLFPPDAAARNRASDQRVITTLRPIELEESIEINDEEHTSLVHKFALVDENGVAQGICGISTDITERKQAEAALRESRRQLESLLGQLPGMAFRNVNDGHFTPVYISRGALGLTGHSARDFLEKHVTLQEIIHPDDREMARSAIASAVKKRRAFEIEYRIIDRSGRVKWVLERGQGVYDEEGKLNMIEGLAIDVTQRKDAEAEKLIVERRLLEGQKLESIGVLAGGIAHDFNNLLTGIIGNANLAALELPPTSRLQQNLKQIENASQRAAELCQQMLAYAGKGRFVVQRVELGTLVENTVPLLRASISKRAMLRFQLRPSLPAVIADPTQMRQIVMNLVLNASEALGDKDGEIVITTNTLRPTIEFFEGAVLVPPDLNMDFVMLEVRDTGSGMSPETMAKIFDPFFTTKFAGRGLGLAAVLGIIRSHRGGLKVLSALGRGSTFTILIPAAAVAIDAPASRRATGAPWRQEGNALVIDDEDHVRNVTAGMLNTCGLKTETARDGYEGVDLFRAKPNHFDIVMLDMTMPRLSGEETLELLREVRPDVRVLFMSGYNRREVVDALAGSGALSFIQKPFTLDSLKEQLRDILG